MPQDQKRHLGERIVRILMVLSVGIVLACTVSIVGTVLVRGIRTFSWDLIPWAALAGSLYIVIPAAVLGAFISVPVVFYITMYRKRSDPVSYIARLAYDILYGIPGIVYGAFAFSLMVYAGMRASVRGGILVTVLLIIPILIRSGDEIARNVPDELIEAVYSLGATRWETLKVILLQILPGMTTAFLLAIGRAIGEAAAVMFTAGFSDTIPQSPTDPAATLPMAVFSWISMPEPFPDKAYAAALILTVIVLLLSLGARWLSRRFTQNNLS